MKTSLLITLLILTSIILGVGILGKISKQNALLNEYEYALAGVWEDNQESGDSLKDCKDQLGIFYVEER